MDQIIIPNHIADTFVLLDGLDIPAWLVGGCLRDILLGRPPKDWDLATPCPPELVRDRLAEARVPFWETGFRHGTLTFRHGGVVHEITTFRRDGPYEDFRRPKWVEFTASIKEDLARRDFTINAIAYRDKEGLTDPFGGITDLEDHIIRAVGSPQERLQEDALRILRGIRFAGSLNFDLDDRLSAAMIEKGELLLKISPERLASELNAMLLLPSPRRALELLAATGVWKYMASEMADAIGFDQKSSHHYLDVYGHMVQTAENTQPVPELRLAALLHDIAKPAVKTVDEEGNTHFHRHDRVGAEMAAVILDRLRFSHALRDRVVMLIRSHMMHLRKLDDGALRRFISDLPKPREENLELILLLQKADLTASRYTEESLSRFDGFASRCRDVLKDGYPLDIADLAVKGEELEGLGIAPAKRSAALKSLLAEVLRAPGQNQRQVLLTLLEPYREVHTPDFGGGLS
ncbi:MAG: CCA tRNA nucleotidyltransferase [Peptococcaceae bacterium]|jgi:tRNA nucleotidyltransferase (CCA-adding enzyme)|nr:CCA tRNA nucleotidyltransferase [Peptococcaceae bacterium]